MKGAPLSLCCHNLGCVRGGRILFARLDVDIGAGEALRVVGDNGCGKTTLLRMLTGLGRPDAGQVLWHGADVRAAHSPYRAELLYLGHAPGIKAELTAWENLVCLDLLAGAAGEAAARAALVRVGLGAQADVPARALSQGQRRRAALARLHLPRRRAVWILDEPFVGLDAGAAAALDAAMAAHRAGGGIVVYTTHQDAGPADARALRLGTGTAC